MKNDTHIESIGFKSPRPKDRTGNPVNEGTDIPVFKGAKKSLRQILKLIDIALEALATEVSCTFWACDGPKRPRDMCTCTKCYAVRDLAIARAALARKINNA